MTDVSLGSSLEKESLATAGVGGGERSNVLAGAEYFSLFRIIAALLVVTGHVRNLLLLDYLPNLPGYVKALYFLTGFGHQAVMIFFVISGFWISNITIGRMRKGSWSWPHYAVDRLSRLWLVLIPALVIGGLLDVAGRFGLNAAVYHGIQGTNTVTFDVATRLNLLNFLGTASFLHNLLVNIFGSNGPLWSLTNEFWYYVWFPVLWETLVHRKLNLLRAVAVIVTMIAFRSLLIGLLCWLCGVALYIVVRRVAEQGRKAPRPLVYAGLAVFGILLIVCLTGARTGRLPGDMSDLAISVTFAGFLGAIILGEFSLPRLLKPFAAYGAGASYSLYATHFPFALLIVGLIAPARRLAPGLPAIGLAFGIAVLCVGYGWIFSRLTEARTNWVRVAVQRMLARFSLAAPA